MGPILLAFALAALAWLLVAGSALRDRHPVWFWYLAGYPVTALRVLLTWRKVAQFNGLNVTRKPAHRVLGDLEVRGAPLRTTAPRISFPRATPTGISLVVRLHPGQTPGPFIEYGTSQV